MERRTKYTLRDAALYMGAGVLFVAGLVLMVADFDARELPLAAFAWTKIGGVVCWLLTAAMYREIGRRER